MNTTITTRLLKFALAGLFAAAPFAHAHSVWVEDTPDKQLVVRFGEPGSEYEKSPGHLDSLSLPLAWKIGAEDKPEAFIVEKKADHFLLVGVEPATAALGETRFPVFKPGKRPASWPQFYVRWHPAGTPAPSSPSLTLDILPTATPGEFRVWLRGQPLPGAKVGVEHLGTGAGAELVADADGIVKYAADKPGIILLVANHKDQTPGFSGGLRYEVVSHNVALSWRQP
jgi:hypothetical protein